MLRITNRSLTRHSRNRDDTPRQLTTLSFYYTAVRKCLARENQTRTFDSRMRLLNSRTFKEMRRSPKIFCHKMAEFNDVGTDGVRQAGCRPGPQTQGTGYHSGACRSALPLIQNSANFGK